jgi:DNA replication protein DnaC
MKTFEELEIEMLNNQEGTMHIKDGINCEKCKNKGHVYFRDEFGEIKVKNCPECYNKRITFRNIEKSGLKKQFEVYDLTKFNASEDYQVHMKRKAMEYIKEVLNGNKFWFMITGLAGVGKSHICTGIAKELINKNKRIKYISYVDLVELYKRYMSGFIEVKDSAEVEFSELKGVEILYIDDYLKVSNVSLDFIYELINYRYSNDLITIFSTERKSSEQMDFDSAITSRIYEKTNKGKYLIEIANKDERNYRIYGEI